METINTLIQQNVGVGAGVALGSAVGFGLRKRAGKSAQLIAGSVLVTAAVCGMVGMSIAMFVSYLGIF